MLMLQVCGLLFLFLCVCICVFVYLCQVNILLTVLLVAACDVPGIKRLLPTQWRELEFFNNIYELVGVPVVTVQLRYSGWVTELQDLERSR